MVKLYSYSSEFRTFVEEKHFKAKYVASGIIMGAVILFGVIHLNQSAENNLGFRSSSGLAADNNFLQEQVNQISPQVIKLEMQARQLNARANKLHILLPYRKIVGDTVLSFMHAAAGLNSRSLIFAARTHRH